MKKTRISFNIIAIIIFVIYALVLILGNTYIASTTIAAESGSYAESYAEDNHIDQYEITDSERDLFYQEYAATDDVPFSYNEINNGKEIEIVRYEGDDDVVAIPTKIDEKEVTSVSMDLYQFPIVIIPKTVTSITGDASKIYMSSIFVFGLIFTIIAFIGSLTVVNILLPKLSNAKEIILTSPQIILSIAYVFAQAIVGILAAIQVISSVYVTIIISAIILGIYYICIFVLKGASNYAIQTEEKIQEKTAWMKAYKIENADLAYGIEDEEVAKQVNRLVEAIKVSDPMDDIRLATIEVKLSEETDKLRQIISFGEKEAILAKIDDVKYLLKKRNDMCKEFK